MLVLKYGGWRDLERRKRFLEMLPFWWRGLCKTCGGSSDSKWFDKMVAWKVGRGEKK